MLKPSDYASQRGVSLQGQLCRWRQSSNAILGAVGLTPIPSHIRVLQPMRSRTHRRHTQALRDKDNNASARLAFQVCANLLGNHPRAKFGEPRATIPSGPSVTGVCGTQSSLRESGLLGAAAPWGGGRGRSD